MPVRCGFVVAIALGWCVVAASMSFDHSHAQFDKVLRQHVKRGMVDYRALKNDPQPLLRYFQQLADIVESDYQNWTRSQKLALWINAYNAYAIKAIIDHYPIEPSWVADPLGHYPANSIRQIPGVWDEMTWPVMGKRVTLDYMEHEILRKKLDEPRIHYVLVCASIGCPLLENRAFDEVSIEQRLDQAARDYIYESHRVRIDRDNKAVGLPQIYKWFEEDFQADEAHLKLFARFSPQEAGWLSWVYRFANDEDRRFLETQDYRLVFLYYDWALNEQR